MREDMFTPEALKRFDSIAWDEATIQHVKSFFYPDAMKDSFNRTRFQHFLGLKLDVVELTTFKALLTDTAGHNLTSSDPTSEINGLTPQYRLHGGAMAGAFDAVNAALAGQCIFLYMCAKKMPLEDIMPRVGKVSTLNMNINYLKVAKGKQFTVESRLVRVGNRTAVVEGSFMNQQGDLLATAQSNMVY